MCLRRMRQWTLEGERGRRRREEVEEVEAVEYEKLYTKYDCKSVEVAERRKKAVYMADSESESQSGGQG